MPVHVVQLVDARPYAEQLADELTRIDSREDIITVLQTGGDWLVITRKRAGRPRKETAATRPVETR